MIKSSISKFGLEERELSFFEQRSDDSAYQVIELLRRSERPLTIEEIEQEFSQSSRDIFVFGALSNLASAELIEKADDHISWRPTEIGNFATHGEVEQRISASRQNRERAESLAGEIETVAVRCGTQNFTVAWAAKRIILSFLCFAFMGAFLPNLQFEFFPFGPVVLMSVFLMGIRRGTKIGSKHAIEGVLHLCHRQLNEWTTIYKPRPWINFPGEMAYWDRLNE